ncbi:helix-turn-helix domain-containing protein [Streptomyces sp. WAC06614]|uniref:helix-turn-helix domain-containing protein n=1 Tax=Streptomyces sp. WAC06614 TaxID=2487416 RepID=UPI000F772BE7|nr:helix-turn-helix domain-containing protein [Streptomyces sp. WAC06614]RSS67489.1 AraC family transcriptional regulator [Streptomyces sp. WAC06614]
MTTTQAVLPLAPPARRSFAGRDTVAACAYLRAAYGARVGPVPGAEAVTLRHSRLDCGTYQLDEVQLGGGLTLEPDPDGQALVLQLRRGELAVVPGCVLGDGRPYVCTTATVPLRLTARSAVLEVTSLTVPLLRQAAGSPTERQPVHVRFTSPGAAGPEAEQLWRSSCEYAHRVLVAATAVVPPLLVGETGRLLAAVALAVFPNNLAGGPVPADSLDATPDALRRAVLFIDENAHTDIGLGHIAAAAHVTPRALQYAFRRHAGTTPLGYLRRVRLDHAHQDLLASDPAQGTTVSIVAARWGFAHAGRFAGLYRQAYGVRPGATLQR